MKGFVPQMVGELVKVHSENGEQNVGAEVAKDVLAQISGENSDNATSTVVERVQPEHHDTVLGLRPDLQVHQVLAVLNVFPLHPALLPVHIPHDVDIAQLVIKHPDEAIIPHPVGDHMGQQHLTVLANLEGIGHAISCARESSKCQSRR